MCSALPWTARIGSGFYGFTTSWRCASSGASSRRSCAGCRRGRRCWTPLSTGAASSPGRRGGSRPCAPTCPSCPSSPALPPFSASSNTWAMGTTCPARGATRAGWSCCWPWPGRSRGWRAFSAAWTPCGTRWRRGAATRPAPLCSPPSTPARAWSTTGCSSSTRWTAFSHR